MLSPTPSTPPASPEEPIIFQPDFRLREKIGRDVTITDLLKPEMLNQAQAVIQQSRQDFIAWIKEDVLFMQELLEQLQETTWDAKLLDQFMRLVLQVKARAGTFGYPLASEIARRLYVFCEEGYRAKADHMLVVRKHTEGLRVVIHNNIEGDGGQVGRELLATLSKLAEKLK